METIQNTPIQNNSSSESPFIDFDALGKKVSELFQRFMEWASNLLSCFFPRVENDAPRLDPERVVVTQTNEGNTPGAVIDGEGEVTDANFQKTLEDVTNLIGDLDKDVEVEKTVSVPPPAEPVREKKTFNSERREIERMKRNIETLENRLAAIRKREQGATTSQDLSTYEKSQKLAEGSYKLSSSSTRGTPVQHSLKVQGELQAAQKKLKDYVSKERNQRFEAYLDAKAESNLLSQAESRGFLKPEPWDARLIEKSDTIKKNFLEATQTLEDFDEMLEAAGQPIPSIS
ncbi:MAG: hypothetical protein KDK76_02325 [Chlamydiia bacterium]|nr:hypothetical protein [Chlamydiia bacterium]